MPTPPASIHHSVNDAHSNPISHRFGIFDKVLKAVKLKGSKALDADDLAYVKAAVAREAIKRGHAR